MKPVELEIFLQDGVSPGLKKAGQTLSRFSGEAKAELREVSESLKLQKSHVSGMEKEYARLEKALKVAAPGKEWMEAKARLAAYKAELDGEKTALQQLEEQQRKLKAEAEGAGQSLRQQLKNVREEIATLLLAYRSLTDAECLCSDANTSAVKCMHRDAKALALLSQHIVLRNPAVCENQLIG